MKFWVIIVFVLSETSGLLQIHTRLAGAILRSAVDRAVRERDGYLVEAERLLSKAEAIDRGLAAAATGGPAVARQPLERLASRGKLKRIVDVEAPVLEPMDVGDVPDDLWLLHFDDSGTEAALSLPHKVVVALVDRDMADRIAGLITACENFPLRATRTPVDDAVAIVETNDGILGIVPYFNLLEEEEEGKKAAQTRSS
mmetsp:Transcript_34577/g.111021  ORF Transcript_34577/g.111021 Transcript_34577/m.111021 type:complete len:199 (+) Transcript_34577:27-623(+)